MRAPDWINITLLIVIIVMLFFKKPEKIMVDPKAQQIKAIDHSFVVYDSVDRKIKADLIRDVINK